MWNETIKIMRQEGWPEGVPTLLVIGPLTVATLDEFMQAVRAEKAPTLIVDMSGVPYVDSTGVGGIINDRGRGSHPCGGQGRGRPR